MFLSKERRDEIRLAKEQIDELNRKLSTLQASFRQRSQQKLLAVNSYVSSVSDKWEYTELVLQKPNHELDELGLAGWELVGITFFDHIEENYRTVLFKYVFKRKLPSIPEHILAPYHDVDRLKEDIERISREIELISKRL
jgi:hypothetical protein